MTHPFASLQNFLDPVSTSEGEPYGPYRYRQIVQERYLIAKHSNISYADTGAMNPSERHMILQFIAEENKRRAEELRKSSNRIKK